MSYLTPYLKIHSRKTFSRLAGRDIEMGLCPLSETDGISKSGGGIVLLFQAESGTPWKGSVTCRRGGKGKSSVWWEGGIASCTYLGLRLQQHSLESRH